MKKSLIALGVVSLLGLGTFNITANASEQVAKPKAEASTSTPIKNRTDCKLSEEQQSLLEKGYNELTVEEKATFDKYHGESKRDLSEEQINEYFKVHDKAFKYMDDNFKAEMKEKREEKQINRENRGQHKGQGNKGNQRGQGNGACNN